MSEETFLTDEELWQGIPAEVAGRLAALFRREVYISGSCIFREGGSADHVYFILSGEVGLDMEMPGRGRQLVLSLGPGDLLGISPLFGGTLLSATATALEKTEVLAADAAEVLRTCAADPAVGYEFMRRVARSLFQRLIVTRLQLLDPLV